MKEKKLKCPVCGSDNIADISVRKNNGVVGPGYSSWSILELYECKECGIAFRFTQKYYDKEKQKHKKV